MAPPSPSLFDKPFALSMGPQKAGTSWLDRYLRWHGGVCLPREVKEIFFFDRHYHRGHWFYSSHFRPAPHHNMMMEVSTTAFDHENAPARVHETFGYDVRLICPLRHPARRSYSLYRHYLRYGIVRGSLQEAVEAMPQILTSSHYADHLGRWMDHFGRENITFLYQEELENDQGGFVRRVCDALELQHKMPTGDVIETFNSGGTARHPVMARAAQGAGDWLRARRLYNVVNFGKAIGLRRFIFGADEPARPHKHDDMQWLAARLNPQAEKLESMLGEKVALWHDGIYE